MNGWVEAVDQDVPHAALGGLVRQALAQSKTNVPMPNFRSSESPTNALLAVAGVKSYNGYALSAREVCIDLDDEAPGFLITPTRNGGAQEGWVRLDELAIRLEREITDGQLGQAVRNALDLAVGRPQSAWRGR
ncbi:hypothetical protein HC031_18470 [Planosporangium thailandense]|uniref:DUF5753 domain-containing protein n=1 Tax=Planosporangium thailandense TaxID=765197 RepID=A0ABX0Y2W9_9ACTN|nr:hypothetical protein [Planosporangium thailandense]NJC71689.1 hypothetical protein [Planosporangium thailandense]